MGAAGEAALLPVYLVCDLSSSMGSDGRATALDGALLALRDAVWLNPVVSDVARIGVIGFGTDARVLLPLCDVALIDELPALRPGGLTSYAAAFTLLRATIERDIAQLRGDTYQVWRPLVFFISDGEPTDSAADWRAARDTLVASDFAGRPDIVAFAVGEASPATMATVATSRCFAARTVDGVRQAITGIGDLVIRSVVASSVSGAVTVPASPSADFDEVDLL
jgi:uncharacterized protein YegL